MEVEQEYRKEYGSAITDHDGFAYLCSVVEVPSCDCTSAWAHFWLEKAFITAIRSGGQNDCNEDRKQPLT